VVACTSYHRICTFWGANIFHYWFGTSTFYLYPVLMSEKKSLETIIVLALAASVAYVWLEIEWLIYVSMGLMAIALISKKLTEWIGIIWFSVSHYLGLVMNYVIMFIIYFLFLCPLAFLQRLMNKNQMRKDRKTDSYFQKRNHVYSEKDIDHPW
jgi:L-cystine uptake protein TcyP (sodium:dicarboxylate symporter family)